MNSIIIDKERIEASGKISTEQNALNDLKAIISSMIDSVRGDNILVISCSIEDTSDGKGDKNPKPAKGDKNPNKPKGDKNPNKPKGGKGGQDKAKQEVDPLAGEAPDKK